MGFEVLTPNAPVNLTAVEKASTSVKISWNVQHDDHAPVPIRSHFVQYRRQLVGDTETQNPLSWVDYSMPISAISQLTSPEIQEITTLVDEGSSISTGLFWLRLDVGQRDLSTRYNNLESSTVSEPIPFDASAEVFEQAIRNIDGVERVRVFRYEVGKYGTSILSDRGRYSWRVEFDVVNGPIPLFEVYKDTLDGEFSGGNHRANVRRLHTGKSIKYESSLVANIGNLDAEAYYEFRVSGESTHGKGPWSEPLRVKTDPFSSQLDMYQASDKQLASKDVKLIAGKGWKAGNAHDPDHVPGAGMGGFDSRDGKDGLVVIISYGRDEMVIPSRTHLYYTGTAQYFIVGGQVSAIDWSTKANTFIDIKLWGGGGAGGGTPRNASCE